MSDLSNVKEIPLEDEIFDRRQCYEIENTVTELRNSNMKIQ